jgi:ribosomal protein L40E
MTTSNDAELVCPECGHPNPAKADYCWECRYDFIRDERVKAKVASRPAPAPKRIPPPYSREHQGGKQEKTAAPAVSLVVYLVELILSVVIVGGSWKLLTLAYPTTALLIPFVLGWIGALGLVWFSEGRLPDVEMNLSSYWSLNPFEFQDDINRKVLDWHITLFLPRIVLRSIRHTFMLFRGAH